MDKNNLQKTIDQIGKDVVSKSLSHAGISIGFCDVHGHYSFTGDKSCPLCPNANGTTATEVEHYIDMNPIDGTNPGQKINPFGI